MFLKPNLYIEHYKDIDLNFIRQKGIKALFIDVDNTLVPYFEPLPTDEAKEFISKCLALDFKICIISNNTQERVDRFASSINLPYYHFASKPLPFKYIKAMKEMHLNKKEIAVLGDQLMTDVIGGKLMGFMTILQKPLVEKDLIYTKINRKIEKSLLKLMNLKQGEFHE